MYKNREFRILNSGKKILAAIFSIPYSIFKFVINKPIDLFRLLLARYFPKYRRLPLYIQKLIASLLLLTLSLSLFSSYIYLFPQQAKAAWYDDSYTYRQRVDITNSGSAQTDYQVVITLNTSTLISAGKMQSNCNDIRVTDVAGKVLPHWVESGLTGTGGKACNATTTQIWAKVPSISTSGATLYIYYGNPAASSVANGNQVFNFFDDFSSSSIDTTKWTITDSTGFSQSSGTLVGTNTTGRLRSITTFTGDYAAETRITINTSPTNGFSPVGFWTSTSNAFGILDHNTTSYIRNDSSWTNFTYNGSGQINRDKVSVAGTAATYSRVGETSGSSSGSATNSGLNSETLTIGERYDDAWTGQSYNASWDFIFVRKTASTEPTIAAPTNEEKATSPIAYYKFDDGTGTSAKDSTSSANNGTISGPTWKTDDQCISSKCLYFNGGTDTVTVSDNSAWDMGANQDFTLSAWIRPTNITLASQSDIYRIFFNLSSNVGYQLMLRGGASNGIGAVIGDGTSQEVNPSTDYSSSFTNNRWSHVEAVYNRSGNLLIYLNGVQIASGNISAKASSSLDNAASKTIGQGGASFKGFIDEVKIYKSARSASQVLADYNAVANGEGAAAKLGDVPADGSNLSNGLVGYWKMDESSGNASDSSGNGNTLTNTNTATFAAGKFGNSTSLVSASSQYFTGGNILNVTTGDFTLSAWVKTNTLDSAYHCILTKNAGSYPNYQLCITAANVFAGGYEVDVSNTSRPVSGTALSTGTWYHVVVTADRTNGTTLYINGASNATAAAKSGTLTNAANLYVGRHDSGLYWNGLIDEVREYNRALSPNEVSQLYTFAPGPIRYYKFDEGSGTTASDSSGGGNTLTQTGTTTWAPGKYGKAFNSTSQGFYQADQPDLDNTSQLTIETWFRPTDVASFQRILAKYYFNSGDFGSWILFRDSTNKIQWRLNRGGSWATIINTTSLSLNTWYHVAAVLDSGGAKLYLNGVLEGFDSTAGTIPDSAYCLTIGYSANTDCTSNSQNRFAGQIDEVKVYNYGRTSGQIVEDMNGGHPLGGSPVASQLLYYKLDQGYGAVAYDSGSLLDNADLFDGPTWTQNGKFGKAVTLDGLNDRIQGITSNPVEYTGGDLSASIWFKPNASDTTTGLIFSKPWNGAGRYNYGLQLNNNNTLTLSVRGNGTGAVLGTTTTALTDGVWSHIAFTLDGATKTGKIYINGVLSATGTHSITNWTPDEGDSNIDLSIGCLYPYGSGWAGDTGFCIQGDVDEIKVYNAALTADQVKLDMNQGQAQVLGAISNANSSEKQAASQEYCVPDGADNCSTPIARYDFEEGSGTTAYDISGSGYDITNFTNSPTYTVGRDGKGINFIGSSSQMLQRSTTAPTLGSGSWTVEYWMKSPLTSANQGHIKKGVGSFNSGGTGWEFRTLNTTLQVARANGSGVATPINTTITANTWNHIVGTYNSSTTTLSLYVNGRLIGTATSTGTYTDSYQLEIGHGHDGYFTGQIDNVRIFAYARTATQVAWDYNKGGPVGWWKFDECQGTTAYDSSGNGNNGVITIGNNPGTGHIDAVGTCATSSTAWNSGATGKRNSSLSFDGIDDYVTVSNPASGILDFGTRDFTVSAWYKFTSSSCCLKPIAKYNVDTSSVGWGLFTGSGYVYLKLGSGSTASQYDSGKVINDGNWHQVTWVLNRSGNCIAYTDGVATSTNNCSAFSAVNFSGNSLMFASNVGVNGFFVGGLDDIRLYNYALTPTQARNLYSDGAATFRPSTGTP